MPTCLSGRTSL